MPLRRTLPLYMRERPRALVLTAARHARRPAGDILTVRHPPRIRGRKILRATLHDLLRPPDQLHRPLARPAEPAEEIQDAATGGAAHAIARRRTGPDQIAVLPCCLDF